MLLERHHDGTVIQLSLAFGPALYGVARDLLGSCPPLLAIAAGFELAALAVILAGRSGCLRRARLG